MTDRLEQLLRGADRNPPRATRDIAGAIRRRRVKQRHTVRIASVVTCVFAVASIAVALMKPKNPPVADVAVPIVAVQASLEDRIHELTIAKLESNATRRRNAAKPQADVMRERDRAALILVYDAQQLAKENRSSDAVALYRRAIELFPQTHWAQVARERLKDMPT